MANIWRLPPRTQQPANHLAALVATSGTVFNEAPTGAIATSGALVLQPIKQVAGAVTPVGVNIYSISRLLVGTLASSSVIVKLVSKILAERRVEDTFTDTNDVLLDAHVGELGATWTRHSLDTGDVIIRNNTIRASTPGVNGGYLASGIPNSPDYDVIADFIVKTNDSGSQFVEVHGRASTTVRTRYVLAADYTGYYLIKTLAGFTSSLGDYTVTLVDGETHRVMLRMMGTTIQAYIDGVLRINATDSEIRVVGQAGVLIYDDNATPSDTTGIHIDNFQAADIASSVLAPVGGLTKAQSKELAGTIASTGQLVNQGAINLGGSLPPIGVDTFQVNKLVAGSIASAGSLTKLVNVFMGGVIASSGTLAAVLSKLLTGTIASAGQIVNQGAINLGGTLPPAGTDTFQVNKLLDGVIASSSILAAIKLAVLDLVGSIASSGQLVNQAGVIATGSLPPVGVNTLQANKLVAGGLASTGSDTLQANKLFAGAITSSGILATVKLAVLALTGAIASVGDLIKQAAKAIVGAVASGAAMTKQANKLVSATLPSSGVDQDQVNKFFSGSIATSAVLVTTKIAGNVTSIILVGTLTPTGYLVLLAIPVICVTDSELAILDELRELVESGYQDELRELVPSGYINEHSGNNDWDV